MQVSAGHPRPGRDPHRWWRDHPCGGAPHPRASASLAGEGQATASGQEVDGILFEDKTTGQDNRMIQTDKN